MRKTLMLAFAIFLAFGLSYALAEEDPFAGLDDAGDTGTDAPDSGSSIRAKKKVKVVPEIFEGIVQKVIAPDERYPMVRGLKVKITKSPKSKSLPHRDIKKKEIYSCIIDFKMAADKIDLTDEKNQVNIGAWYFEKGDKVVGIVKEKKAKGLILDTIQRKSKGKGKKK